MVDQSCSMERVEDPFPASRAARGAARPLHRGRRMSPRRLALAASLAAITLPSPAAAVEYVNDSLTSSTAPGRGSQGGSFGPEGWTTGGPTDTVWYEIPAALPEGRVEYSVRGISTSGSLSGADHDLFALYQAPSGQGEPIAYSPYFRNNDLKVFTRIFGQVEGDRAGAIKIELAFCPRGDPWYHDAVCDPSCGAQELAYAGGAPKDVGWDGGAWYRMAVYWGNGKMAFSRDGAELGSVGYPGSYSPAPARVRLGSPRHGISAEAFMPSGLTFKDVIISGAPGVETAVCAEPGPDAGPIEDAGAPDAGPADAGACAADHPLSFGGLTPSSGAGVEGVFRAVYQSCQGASAFRVVQFWVGDKVDAAAPNLSGGYEAGQVFAAGQSCAPGEDKLLTTPLGAVDCARTTVTPSGDDLVVEWALRFDLQSFAGPHLFFVDAKGGPATPEPRLGWTDVGTWTVAAPVTPDGGSGGSMGVDGGGGSSGSTGVGGSGGAGGEGQGGSGGESESAGGCGCALPGGAPSAWTALLLAALGLAALGRRR